MSKTFLLFLVSCFILGLYVSCASDTRDDDDLRTVLSEWRNWLEASSPPDIAIELPFYCVADTVLSPDSCALEFYMIEDFVLANERIYLSDGASQKLLSFSIEGDLLWVTGGEGEGPGLFTGIGEIAVNGESLAVCNHGVGRIDIFSSSSGEWLNSFSVLWPFDLCFLPDGNLIVLSLLEENLVTVFSPTGEVIRRFGDWYAPGQDILNSMFCTANRNMRLTLVNDSTIAINSYYFNWGQIYNVLSGEMIATFRRNLPYEEKPIEVGNGAVYGKIYTNDIATYQESIAILNRPIEANWDLPERYDEIHYREVAFSMIDLYGLSGTYLGSMAIPGKVSRIVWCGDNLYGATDDTGELIRYQEIYN